MLLLRRGNVCDSMTGDFKVKPLKREVICPRGQYIDWAVPRPRKGHKPQRNYGIVSVSHPRRTSTTHCGNKRAGYIVADHVLCRCMLIFARVKNSSNGPLFDELENAAMRLRDGCFLLFVLQSSPDLYKAMSKDKFVVLGCKSFQRYLNEHFLMPDRFQ